MSQDVIGNLKFVKEKQILSGFFHEISMDSGRFCYGVKETMRIFDSGAIETLIVWEDLEHNMIKCKLPESDAIEIL